MSIETFPKPETNNNSITTRFYKDTSALFPPENLAIRPSASSSPPESPSLTHSNFSTGNIQKSPQPQPKAMQSRLCCFNLITLRQATLMIAIVHCIGLCCLVVYSVVNLAFNKEPLQVLLLIAGSFGLLTAATLIMGITVSNRLFILPHMVFHTLLIVVAFLIAFTSLTFLIRFHTAASQTWKKKNIMAACVCLTAGSLEIWWFVVIKRTYQFLKYRGSLEVMKYHRSVDTSIREYDFSEKQTY